jgi:hypothetical protein
MSEPDLDRFTSRRSTVYGTEGVVAGVIDRVSAHVSRRALVHGHRDGVTVNLTNLDFLARHCAVHEVPVTVVLDVIHVLGELDGITPAVRDELTVAIIIVVAGE